MTPSELVKRKQQLNADMLHLLLKFQSETGFVVTDVKVTVQNYGPLLDDKQPLRVDCKVEL